MHDDRQLERLGIFRRQPVLKQMREHPRGQRNQHEAEEHGRREFFTSERFGMLFDNELHRTRSTTFLMRANRSEHSASGVHLLPLPNHARQIAHPARLASAACPDCAQRTSVVTSRSDAPECLSFHFALRGLALCPHHLELELSGTQLCARCRQHIAQQHADRLCARGREVGQIACEQFPGDVRKIRIGPEMRALAVFLPTSQGFSLGGSQGSAPVSVHTTPVCTFACITTQNSDFSVCGFREDTFCRCSDSVSPRSYE